MISTVRILSLLKRSHPVLMGILNVTPDSFSDGGRHAVPETALERARAMLYAGADIIDVGGESTRPGADPVPAEEQLRRILPVVETLRRELPGECPISIDTTRSGVAEAALKAGADMVNDISAGRDDPAMFATVARFGAPIVLTHMQGTPKTMQVNPTYTAVVDEVLGFLMERAALAHAAGIPPENILIDPGIGFGKRKCDNLELLANLGRFVETGYRVLLGTSRKRFMGAICNIDDPTQLVTATAVTTALGVMAGVRVFRIHDVRENRQAADVAIAIKNAAKPS